MDVFLLLSMLVSSVPIDRVVMAKTGNFCNETGVVPLFSLCLPRLSSIRTYMQSDA